MYGSEAQTGLKETQNQPKGTHGNDVVDVENAFLLFTEYSK